MNVLLCYPPDFSVPSMPFGALPLFNACLRRAGHRVKVLDLAALTFNRLIERPRVEFFLEHLERELASPAAEPERFAQQVGLAQLGAVPADLLLGAEEAVGRLRQGTTFFDPEQMRHDMRSILAVVRVLSFLRPRLDPRNEGFTESLFGHLGEVHSDAWLDVYERHLLEEVREFAPDLVAVTVPFSTQITGAMQFSKWIHRHFPEARTVFGGTGISDAEHVILRDARFFDYVDYAIGGEGEVALPLLAELLEAGEDIERVPALFHRKAGEIIRPQARPFVDMNASPTPLFDGIDFSLYAAPEKIASLTTSRGCYYGKCTFCPESFRLRFRRRGSRKAWEDVRHIALEQGINNFMFWDPLTPPGMLREISSRSAEEGVEINWMAQVKFDEIYTDWGYVRTLKEGGCRWLQFGFESGVQKVLDAMQKGNDLGRIEVILDRLEEAEITVGVFWFIGFPTESEEEARETWRYLVRRRHRIALSGYIGTFGMGHDVPVFKNPERFGIDLYTSPQGDIAYRRRDGQDWDFSNLHDTYFSRNDQYLIESGTALLYAKRGRERAAALTARRVAGPPEFIRPQFEGVDLHFPRENGITSWPQSSALPNNRTFAYVASSGLIHALDHGDRRIIEQVCRAEDLEQMRSSTGFELEELRIRLARLIDLCILDTRPMGSREGLSCETPQEAEYELRTRSIRSAAGASGLAPSSEMTSTK